MDRHRLGKFVLTPNPNNARVVAHVFVTSQGDALATGYAAGGPGSGGDIKVPDGGSTIALLGFALLGMVVVAGVIAALTTGVWLNKKIPDK